MSRWWSDLNGRRQWRKHSARLRIPFLIFPQSSILLFFFFSSRRRHTRLTCDWSSDMCSSDLDGKGKGITAPNPIGQRLAVERAWHKAGVDPASATMCEAHGTSTRVGDSTELESLGAVFGGAAAGSIALGSVKSNIGHLKSA